MGICNLSEQWLKNMVPEKKFFQMSNEPFKYRQANFEHNFKWTREWCARLKKIFPFNTSNKKESINEMKTILNVNERTNTNVWWLFNDCERWVHFLCQLRFQIITSTRSTTITTTARVTWPKLLSTVHLTDKHHISFLKIFYSPQLMFCDGYHNWSNFRSE